MQNTDSFRFQQCYCVMNQQYMQRFRQTWFQHCYCLMNQQYMQRFRQTWPRWW